MKTEMFWDSRIRKYVLKAIFAFGKDLVSCNAVSDSCLSWLDMLAMMDNSERTHCQASK